MNSGRMEERLSVNSGRSSLGDLLDLFEVEPAPPVPRRLETVTYAGKTIPQLHAESKFIYECRGCNVPVILADSVAYNEIPPPDHGDTMEGHCRVCFETSTRKRAKRCDYPRKFCGVCSAWVDSTHFERHLQSRGHEKVDEGTCRSRRVDWNASREWLMQRRDGQIKPSLTVQPDHVYWAEEYVELAVIADNIHSDARLEIEVAATPGFAVVRLLQQSGSYLKFSGFNPEFGLFNGQEPTSDWIPASLKLTSRNVTVRGQMAFYKRPRGQTEAVKDSLRQMARNMKDSTLEMQRKLYQMFPNEEFADVAKECNFKYFLHLLMSEKYSGIVAQITKISIHKNLILEFLGCDFQQEKAWAIAKLQIFIRSDVLPKSRAVRTLQTFFNDKLVPTVPRIHEYVSLLPEASASRALYKLATDHDNRRRIERSGAIPRLKDSLEDAEQAQEAAKALTRLAETPDVRVKVQSVIPHLAPMLDVPETRLAALQLLKVLAPHPDIPYARLLEFLDYDGVSAMIGPDFIPELADLLPSDSAAVCLARLAHDNQERVATYTHGRLPCSTAGALTLRNVASSQPLIVVKTFEKDLLTVAPTVALEALRYCSEHPAARSLIDPTMLVPLLPHKEAKQTLKNIANKGNINDRKHLALALNMQVPSNFLRKFMSRSLKPAALVAAIDAHSCA